MDRCAAITGAVPSAVEEQRVALSYAQSGHSREQGVAVAIGRRRRRGLRIFCNRHRLPLFRAGRAFLSAFSTTARLSSLDVIPVEKLITNR